MKKATLEEAQALGFDSIEACEKHQKWLDGQKEHREEMKKVVEDSQYTGILDLRNTVFDVQELKLGPIRGNQNAGGNGRGAWKNIKNGTLFAHRREKSFARLGKPGVYSLSIAIGGVFELETSGTAEECDKIIEGYV